MYLLIKLELFSDAIFKITKLLYGVFETENYWFNTYYSYYYKKNLIIQSTYNSYLLYTSSRFKIVGF